MQEHIHKQGLYQIHGLVVTTCGYLLETDKDYFMQKMEENQMVASFEELQHHKLDLVFEKAQTLLTTYFEFGD